MPITEEDAIKKFGVSQYSLDMLCDFKFLKFARFDLISEKQLKEAVMHLQREFGITPTGNLADKAPGKTDGQRALDTLNETMARYGVYEREPNAENLKNLKDYIRLVDKSFPINRDTLAMRTGVPLHIIREAVASIDDTEKNNIPDSVKLKATEALAEVKANGTQNTVLFGKPVELQDKNRTV